MNYFSFPRTENNITYKEMSKSYVAKHKIHRKTINKGINKGTATPIINVFLRLSGTLVPSDGATSHMITCHLVCIRGCKLWCHLSIIIRSHRVFLLTYKSSVFCLVNLPLSSSSWQPRAFLPLSWFHHFIVGIIQYFVPSDCLLFPSPSWLASSF